MKYDMNTRSITLGVCVSSLLIGLLTQSPDLITLAQEDSENDSPATSSVTKQSESDPCDIARATTVKVLAGGSWGSGILVRRQETRYTVLTNAHVLIGNSYKIQTHDGETYPANLLNRFDGNNSSGDDLAILQFDSQQDYQQAILAPISSLRERQEVLAAGFPVNTTPYPDRGANGIVCLRSGSRSSLILERPMQEGYRIGYDIDIAKGMSGGPLLNEEGEVIGVNGKHSDPVIFRNPDIYVYKNGDRVQEPLDLMASLSWAIPIETFVQQAPLSLQLTPGPVANLPRDRTRQTPPPAQQQSPQNGGATAQNRSSPERTDDSQASSNLPTQAANSQNHVTPTLSESEIKNRAEKITVLVSSIDKSSQEKPLGAGVLVAQQGTTYYALTHESVIPPHYYEDPGSRFSVGYNQQRYELSNIRRAGTGLVLLQFTSNHNDEVALVGDATDLEENSNVYIAGWKMGQGESWEFIFTKAQIISHGNLQTEYLVADNNKTRGIKGGPVIDENGMLVAIHKIGGEGISIDNFLRVASSEIQSLLARQYEGRSAITPQPPPRTRPHQSTPSQPRSPSTNSIQPPDPDGPPLPRCSETLWGECIP